MGKVTEDSRSYEKPIFSGNIDTCNVAKGTLGNFVISSLVERLKDRSNFTFSCPQKKGFYYVTNVKTIDGDALPKQLFGDTGHFESTTSIKAKLNSSKTLVPVVSIKVRGRKT